MNFLFLQQVMAVSWQEINALDEETVRTNTNNYHNWLTNARLTELNHVKVIDLIKVMKKYNG